GGQFARLLRPLFGNQAESLDGLEIGQSGVDVADQDIVKGNDPPILQQFGARPGADIVVAAPLFESGKIGRDDGGDELVPVADQGDLTDKDIVLQFILDGLG